MTDSRFRKLECVMLCVENHNSVPFLNLRRSQFTAAPVCAEEERHRCAVNIFDFHVKTKQCRKVDDLGQQQPMPSWSVGKSATAFVELGIKSILAW